MKAASLISLAITLALPGVLDAAPNGYFDLPTTVTLESGDTWMQSGQKFRLFGVQSCLRGTSYTAKDGSKRDCGDASMAMFAAYIRDTKPVCAAVAKTGDLTYVMCYATVAGKMLDLGTILISTGFAFAALNQSGIPYNPAYAVAEQQARDGKSGLWAFPDVQHPAILISKAAKRQGTGK